MTNHDILQYPSSIDHSTDSLSFVLAWSTRSSKSLPNFSQTGKTKIPFLNGSGYVDGDLIKINTKNIRTGFKGNEI